MLLVMYAHALIENLNPYWVVLLETVLILKPMYPYLNYPFDYVLLT